MITITIKTDNDAFEDGNRPTEVARILRDLADSLDGNEYLPVNIRDVNGNHVGNVVLTGKDREL